MDEPADEHGVVELGAECWSLGGKAGPVVRLPKAADVGPGEIERDVADGVVEERHDRRLGNDNKHAARNTSRYAACFLP